MVIFIITDENVQGFAHRLLNNGTMESAVISQLKVGGDSAIVIREWQPRGQTELDLTGGDLALIQGELKRFNQIFKNHVGLPRRKFEPKPEVLATEPK